MQKILDNIDAGIKAGKAKALAKSELGDLLYAVVDEAKKVYGNPQYKYYKLHVRWNQPRNRNGRPRGDGYHTSERPNEKNEVTEQEYNENIAMSKKDSMRAFMGELKFQYIKYEKEMVVDGWRESLIKLVESI